MKKVLLFALLTTVVVLVTTGVAFAAYPDTATYGQLNGTSKTDNHPEGQKTDGYAGYGYDEPVSGQSPHGGWTSTSDKCKMCHAPHYAWGSRNLLRSSTGADDCAYCHSSTASGAGQNAYVFNKFNGHTMEGGAAFSQAGKAYNNQYGSGVKVKIPGSSSTQTVYRANADGVSCNMCHQGHANPENIVRWKFKSLNTMIAAPWQSIETTTSFTGAGGYRYNVLAGTSPETWDTTVGSFGSQDVEGRRISTETATGWLFYDDDYAPNYGDATTKILVKAPFEGIKSSATSSTAANPYYGEAVRNTTDAMGNAVYPSPLISKVGDWSGYNYGVTKNGTTTLDPSDPVDAELWNPDLRGLADSAISDDFRSEALTRWCGDCHNRQASSSDKTKAEAKNRVRGGGDTGVNITTNPTTTTAKYSHSTFLDGRNVQNTYETSYGYGSAERAPSCFDCHTNQGTGDEQWRWADFPHTGSTNSYALLKNLPKRDNTLTSADETDSPAILDPIVNDGSQGSTYDAAGLDNVCRTCHAPEVNGTTYSDSMSPTWGNRSPSKINFTNF